MNRRILIIGLIVLLILVVGGIAAYFYLRNDSGIAVGPNPFAPAGDRDPGSLDPVVDTGVPTPGAGELVAPRLLKLTENPVARGTVSLYTPAKTATTTSTTTTAAVTPEETEVRYIDRQSGNVYAFRIHERVVTRLSNKTLPGIEEAAWVRDGSRAFVRFLEKDGAGAERVSTYILPATGEGGFFLEPNLSEVRVASTSVLTLLASGTGSIASLMNPDGSNVRSAFSSPLGTISAQFAGGNYLVQTRPTVHIDGYAFLVDRAGTFTRLLGPLRGLSTLASPSGTTVLYSYTDRGKLYTQVLDTAARATVPLPLATLPEKCVWTSDGTAVYCAVPTSLTGLLPDEWHQGARSFSDRVWRIDLATRVATLIFDPRQLADATIDAEALSLDAASDVLIFMNRIDGTLWAYDL